METMTNVTSEQLMACVKAAQRMRETARAHLSMLERRIKRASEEGNQIPSEDNFFLYVADEHGLIRTQQDAAFIVESVLVLPPPTQDIFAFIETVWFEMSLIDENSGRALTGGFRALSRDPLPLEDEESSLIPGVQFVPITSSPFEEGTPNVDDWKMLRSEYIIPRASVLRAAFLSRGAYGLDSARGGVNPDVVLVGYKVF